jgi:microcystin-dependent protein
MFADFDSAELPEPLALAFQRLYAQLRAFVAVSFNEDGTLIPAPPNVGISPIGAVQAYAGATDPPNWLICDGRAVSRVTYASLFAVIGTAYGAGDGSTSFNIPDLRQRFILGKAAAGTGATLGSTGGAIDHTHAGGAITGSTAGATATISGSTGSTAPGTDTQGSHNHGGSTGSHTHTYSGVTGANNQTFSYTRNGSLNAAPDEGHTHNYSGTTDASTASISSDGSHSHTVNSHSHTAGTLSVDSHSHGAGTLAMAATGSANPPYAVLNFVILAGV